MTDAVPPTTENETTPTVSPSAGTQNTEQTVPYSRFKEVNEAAKAAAERLAALEAAEKQRQEQEALARGEHQKVIDGLKPKAERADVLEAALKGYLDAELAELTDEQRGLVPDGDVTAQLAWLKKAKASGLFARTQPPPPPTDAGNRGDSSNAIVADARSQAAAQLARQYGYSLTAEQIAARQKQIEHQRRNPSQGD